MRNKVIFGNWKMFKTNDEAVSFIKTVEETLTLPDNIKAGVGVPFTALADAKKVAKKITVCAQNVHFEESGAFTGEISIPMLKSIGVDHVIIGHSERREMFNETDETVNKKAIALLKNNMTPVLCCGESLEIYEKKQTLDFVKNQIIKGFANISESDAQKVIIAYEPIWAIGTGKVATADEAQSIIKGIRDILANMYSNDVAQKIIIQYGGSVKPDNIKEILSKDDIDGALVGGASLDAKTYLGLFENAK